MIKLYNFEAFSSLCVCVWIKCLSFLFENLFENTLLQRKVSHAFIYFGSSSIFATSLVYEFTQLYPYDYRFILFLHAVHIY